MLEVSPATVRGGQLLVALLLAGHFTGDFLLQTGSLVRRKREPAWLGVHVLLVMLAQTLFLAFFVPWGVLLTAIAGITLAHAALDALKPSLEAFLRHDLWAFLVDQLAHVAVLLGFAAWILPRGFTAEPASLPWGAELSWAVAVVVIAVALAGWGGAVLVQLLLQRFGPGAAPGKEAASADADAASEHEAPLGAGRALGIVERLLILALVVADAWVAVGLVLVAESVVRLSGRAPVRPADRYLIGTLTSALIAVVVGLASRAALG